MENNKQENLDSKNLVLELSLRVSLKDYKIRFTTERAWFLSLILLILRLCASFGDSSAP